MTSTRSSTYAPFGRSVTATGNVLKKRKKTCRVLIRRRQHWRLSATRQPRRRMQSFQKSGIKARKGWPVQTKSTSELRICHAIMRCSHFLRTLRTMRPACFCPLFDKAVEDEHPACFIVALLFSDVSSNDLCFDQKHDPSASFFIDVEALLNHSVFDLRRYKAFRL